MDIKLTPAQERLISALKTKPDSDVYDHLKHIHNQQIRDQMINTLLHLGLLRKDTGNGKVVLNFDRKSEAAVPEYEPETESESTTKTTDITVGTEDDVPNNKNEMNSSSLNKKAVIMEMLTRRTSLSEMMEVTGWLEKSVRGVISQLKKEKKLIIVREKDENKQNYYSIKASEAAN